MNKLERIVALNILLLLFSTVAYSQNNELGKYEKSKKHVEQDSIISTYELNSKSDIGWVSNNMISKDLRFAGKLYRPLFNNLYKGMFKKNKKDKTLKSKEEDYEDVAIVLATNKKKKFSVYIQREDSTYLRLLIMKPEGNIDKVPCVLWIHGGGYAIGKPENSKVRALIKTNQYVIVAPAYIKSVDRPYPAALNDCYLALIWMKEHAYELGIKDDQLFVGGESAGGGLTVATCIMARDKGEVNIAFQMPLYPMLDDRMNTKSMINNNAPIWNEVSNKRAWNLYLAGLQNKEIPKYAAPAREIDYSNLPPALTFVGEIDPFYDETRIYVQNLQNEGISVDFKTFSGAYHAFDLMVPRSKTAKEADIFWIQNFKIACQKYFAPQLSN